MGNFINNLNSNASNWEILGKIKPEDKINVSGTSLGKGVGTVSISSAGAFQGVFRAFSKAVNSNLADAYSTTNWISHFQGKNMRDLDQLHKHVELCNDQTELKEILKSLNRMKSAIRSSNEGFQNLAETYGREREYHSNVSLKEALIEKQKVNDVILGRLDDEIAHIRDKFIEESYESVSTKEAFETKNSADEAVEQIKRYVIGEGVATNEKIVKDKEGNDVKLPQQFFLDIGRSPHVELNGQKIYSSREKDKYNEASVYKLLLGAVGNSERAVQSIMNLTTQGMFADSLQHASFIGIKPNGFPDMLQKCDAIDFQYLIKIEGDKVSLTLNNGYTVTNRDDPEGPPEGYRLVKREFELSLKELQALQPNSDRSVETVSAKDTYSTLIKELDTVTNLYKFF